MSLVRATIPVIVAHRGQARILHLWSPGVRRVAVAPKGPFDGFFAGITVQSRGVPPSAASGGFDYSGPHAQGFILSLVHPLLGCWSIAALPAL